MRGVPPFDDDPLVGVVESDPDDALGPEAVHPIRSTSSVSGSLAEVLRAEPSLLVVSGASTLSAVARAGVDVPVLPVGTIEGIPAVDEAAVPAAIDATLEGAARVDRHDVLRLDVDVATTGPDGAAESAGTDGSIADRALFDVTLVASEPARISEYGVWSRGESIATFRADGVVVATAAGTCGYAGTVDAPTLSSAVDAVVVAPIAPFTKRARRWVLPSDDAGLSVERDECAVTLVVDGRERATIPCGSRVRIAADGTLRTVVPDEIDDSARIDG